MKNKNKPHKCPFLDSCAGGHTNWRCMNKNHTAELKGKLKAFCPYTNPLKCKYLRMSTSELKDGVKTLKTPKSTKPRKNKI